MNHRVVITRASCGADMAAAAAQAGFAVSALAPTSFHPLDDGLRRLESELALGNDDARRAIICFSSPRTHTFLDDEVVRLVQEHTVAAIGEGTANAMRESGLEPSFVGPQPASGKNFAEAIAQAFTSGKLEPAPILHPCSERASDEFASILTAHGHSCTDIHIYAPMPRSDFHRELQESAPAAIVVTAPSALAQATEWIKANEPVVVVLGKPTMEAALNAGINAIQSATPQVPDIIAALEKGLSHA